MNKLDRFRFGNFHKRKMFGLLGIIAAVFVLGLGSLALFGVFGSRSEYVSIRLNSANTGITGEGVGISLSDIPSVNRINYSSFASTYDYRSATVADCTDSYIFFDPDSGLKSEDVVIGSEVKVVALDNDGVLSVRYSGLVNGFDTARFGLFTPIEDSHGFWLNDVIKDIESIDGVIVAITDAGELITDLSSEDLVKVFEETESDFVDVCKQGQMIYAATLDGSIYGSSDGRSFALVSNIDLADDSVVQIAGVNNGVVALTSYGKMYICGSGNIGELEVPFDCSEITLVNGDDCVLAISPDFDVYVSANGFVFSEVTVPSEIKYSADVVDCVCSNDVFYILNSLGQVIVIDTAEADIDVRSIDISSIEPTKIEVADNSNLVVVTSDKKACLVSTTDGAVSDLTSNSGNVDDVFKATDERLIIKSGNNLNYVTVLQRLQVNSSIPEDSVNSGDLCYIQIVNNPGIASEAENESGWMLMTNSTSFSPYSTVGKTVADGSCRLLGVGDGVHAISQKLSGSASDNLTNGVFYRLSVNLKSDSEVNNVMVWISGEEFGEEGFTIDKVGVNPDDYSYVFAITDTSRISENDTLYVNIAFEGDGVLYIDNAYLGEDKYELNDIPDYYVQSVIDSHPSAIEFDNVNFACSGFSQEIFYGLGTDSLESSLKLTLSALSNPWIEVGSYADSESVDNLLGYLCGSVSSEYGKLRIDNGTAIPWARQFDTIYIEITDSDNAYLSDMQRGAYVSYVKGLFAQSTYYNEVKGRIVFLDGMDYEGGIVLASADYHVQGGSMDLADYASRGMIAFRSDYVLMNYEIPRMNSLSDNGEFFSPLSFINSTDPLSVGVFTAALSDSEFEFSKLVMVDLVVSDNPVDIENGTVFSDPNAQFILSAVSELQFMKDSNSLYFEVLDPLSIESSESAEGFLNDCSVNFVEQDGIAYLVVANPSGVQHQFVVDGYDYQLNDNARIIRYSNTGEIITDRDYRRSDLRFTLQPGETLVIIITPKN